MKSIFSNSNGFNSGNNANLLRQFAEFKKSIKGRDPNAMLQELLNSGRFTQEDVEKARELATTFQSLLR